MLFNIDEDMIFDVVGQSLEDAAYNATQEQFQKIYKEIGDKMPDVIEVLTYGVQEFWKNEARNSGTGWGAKYAAAIKAEVTGNMGHIYVDESMTDKSSHKPSMMFVNMVENGMSSFSIKDALLASEKAKIGKNGMKYIVIPFPVAAPRKESSGKMNTKFGGREMSNEVYNIVKGGGKLSSGTINVRGKEIDISGLSRWNNQQLHSGYGIFRVVSEKSTGWIHPGKQATPVYPTVLAEVEKQIGQVLSSFCSAIVEKYTR
jgi:hypothetical protein